MAKVPGGHVGAGTVLTPDDVKRAKDAGASFAVSPGATERLVGACKEAELPPAARLGHRLRGDAGDGMGLFDAEILSGRGGGRRQDAEIAGRPAAAGQLLPDRRRLARQCAGLLSLSNVICVGGSWISPDAEVAAGNWAAIEARAREARALK